MIKKEEYNKDLVGYNNIIDKFDTVKAAAESVGSRASALRVKLQSTHNFKNFYWWYANEWEEQYGK